MRTVTAASSPAPSAIDALVPSMPVLVLSVRAVTTTSITRLTAEYAMFFISDMFVFAMRTQPTRTMSRLITKPAFTHRTPPFGHDVTKM
jgi:hypothetical protein